MCGIFGGFDWQGRPFGETLAQRMGSRLKHRGPDDQGHYEAEGLLIGNRRLSIIDLDGGHQPMLSDDGQIGVVQNGEIYNYRELSENLACKTESDTEVILRLYEREGPDFVKKLNGMFAIAIVDRRERRLVLYRDRLGQKPLFFFRDAHRLLFASEIKSLLAAGIPREIDWEALDAYLTYNYVPLPITLFKGVRHLEPGHRVIIDSQGVHDEAWWRLAQCETEDRTEEAWMEGFLSILSDAVKIRLRSDVPLGAFLSGGIDSSTIVKVMSDFSPHPVKTFCMGFDDKRYDESPYAADVARHCRTDHVCEVVQPNLIGLWPLVTYHNDQPHGDASFMPMYMLSSMARKHVKVVLTGDGGDELFAGYRYLREFFQSADPAWPQEKFERALVESNCIFTQEAKRPLYSLEMARRVRGVDPYTYAEVHLKDLRHLDRINQALGLEAKLLLPGNNLVKPDKMAMAVSLEPRAPFLDVRMVDFAFRMPGDLKLRNGETKYIYKKAMERVLSHEIIHRDKQMFTVPIGEWFKGSLLPFVKDVLLTPRSTGRGMFNSGYVATMIEDHRSGRVNYTRQIRALIALELWQRIFFDGDYDGVPQNGEIGLPEASVS